jgi:hypothetical protein
VSGEWGIFTSEGLLEGDFWSESTAEGDFWSESTAEGEIAFYVRQGDIDEGEARVGVVCPMCRGDEEGSCADCGDLDEDAS